MEWGSYDPAVLAAIDLGHVTSLDRLVANIDVSNHDVPSHSVLAPAVGRLVGAQLVEAHGHGYRVTPAGRALLKGVRDGTISRVGEVRDRLRQIPPGRQAQVLAEDDWAAAVDRYVARHHARRRKGPRRWISWRTASRR